MLSYVHNQLKGFESEQKRNFSKKLSKEFPFARIDFYETKDKLYFGEMVNCKKQIV